MENELKTNAVKLSPEEQYQIRKSIVRMSRQGKENPEIAQLLDVSERHVRNVKKLYAEQGIEGIKPKKRGRNKGEKCILTKEQEREIQRIIVDNNPEQLKLPGCMWTRNNISELIKNKFGIEIKFSTLGYYLQRWGFSVQRPIKRARKQDEKQIETWLNEEFPGITERAENENAEIFFGDEAGIQNTANYAKGYAPKGKTPIVQIESKKMRINMLSAISKRGKLRFMLYKDNMTSDKLIDFMRRLVQDTDKKVFLILDNLRIHHSKKVRAWLENHRNEIEVFFLPPYAPEYNPDELLNSDLKRNVGNRAMPKTEQELEHNVRSHLKSLQLKPYKISSFFKAKFTIYAAA
jgi:transposase